MGNDAKRGLLCPEGPGQVEGKSSVSIGDPSSQQEDRAHKTWHMGTSAMDYRLPPSERSQPRVALGSPLPFRLKTSTPVRSRTQPPPHQSMDTRRSPNPQKVSKPPPGKQPLLWAFPQSPGLPHGALSSPTLAPPGLLITAGEVLAASSSQRTGAEIELPPLLRYSRHSLSPANEPHAPA